LEQTLSHCHIRYQES